MSMWLRQSTASQEILLGKFVDSTDAVTAETALTIANTDIQVWKEGATTLANKNSGGATHISGGLYYAVLDATDTDTLGKLEVNVAVSGALAVRREYMVLPAMVYDSMVLGTDVLQADMTQFLGDAQSATDLKDFADAGYDPSTNKVQGVVLVDTTTTNSDMRGTDSAATSTALATAQADLDILTGTDGAIVATGGITAASIATGAIDADALAADAIAEIADGVWDEATAGHVAAGSTGEAIIAAGGAGDPWITTLPGSYTGSQAGKILADVLVDTGTTLDGKLTTAQADLDILTGTDGATLATSQANYAPAKAGDAMALTTSERSTLYTGIWSAGTRTLTSISALASEIASAVWLAASATYGLTLSTMGRLLHNGGAAAADTTATGTPGATSLQITDGSTVDDFYNDMVMYVDSSDGAGQARPITDYVGSTKTLSFDEDLVVLPVSTDRIVIRAAHVHPKTQQAIATRAEMDANSTKFAAIVEDTNEIQTDWANGGRLDVILDARASQSSVDDLPTNSELAAAITTGLTTALTEGYRATGATGSVRDILYEILGHMANKGIAGTTLTTKKLDKTTTAKTYTLDADPATSIEEAT